LILNKSVILDRDGIINHDYGYVYKIEDFKFKKGIFRLLKQISEKQFLLFIVTNQSGIGRGYFSEENFLNLNQWMLSKFKKKGIRIESVKYCPHDPETNCDCRKPRTKLVEELIQKYKIDPDKSWFIGDKQSDMECAENAGIKNKILVSDDVESKKYKVVRNITDINKHI